MRLQSVEVKEIAEKGAGGEAGSTLEVSEEDDPLASARGGHDLRAEDAPLDLCRHLAGANQSLDVARGDLGPLPAPVARLRGIPPGSHGVRGGARRGTRS